MTRRLRVLVAATALAAGAGVAVAAGVSPRSLVLQPADVPAGLVRTVDRHIGAAELVQEQGSVRPGFVTGWEAQFAASKPAGGIVEITSRVSVYKTSDAARASLLWSYRRALAKPPAGWTVTRLDVAPVGGLARMYALHGHTGGKALTVYAVIWQSAKVKASVFVGGATGSVRLSQAKALAARQQALRISGSAPVASLTLKG